MAFTFNVATDAGKVRLLIPDRESTDPFFQDDEIDALLELEESVVRRAAALALETMASDAALCLKAVRLLDIQTDGKSVAEALLARAKVLRAQADTDEMDDDGGLFDIAEMVPNTFAWRERVWNEELRDG